MAETRAGLALAQTTMVLRASYFTRSDVEGSAGFRRVRVEDSGDKWVSHIGGLREPTVTDAERAFSQLRLLNFYASLLPGPTTEIIFLERHSRGQGLPIVGPMHLDDLEAAPRLRSTSMGSLNIAIDIMPWLFAAGPIGLLSLAYGICTFGPRVSAKRETMLLEAYRARSERQRLQLEAASAPLTALLRDAGPSRMPGERGPDYLDLVNDDDDDDLVDWDPEQLLPRD